MPLDVDITLYHANRCGYCKDFIPEWRKFDDLVKSGKMGHKNARFTSQDIEHGQVEKMIDRPKIAGYPTIKVTVKSNGKLLHDFEYDGKRRASEMEMYLMSLVDGMKNN